MTAGVQTKLRVEGVISIRLPSATNEPQATELLNSPSFVARKTALIFNSPFEYDVIETFVRAQEELVYSICSRTRSPKLWDEAWKRLYLIAFVDLVPVATEKVSLIRLNII